MAKKLKINYVKSVNSTTLVAKMRVKVDISPDAWEDLSASAMEFWYSVGEDPSESNTHAEISCYKRKESSSGKWMWYWGKLENLTTGLKYHILATGVGESGTRYKSTVTIASPVDPEAGRSMFSIVNKDGEWEDFTDCIPIPDYKINNTDVREEWEDGNYDLHSSVVQTRIKGSLTLRFPNRYRLNKFLECIQYNEDTYGKGRIRLRVQVNNELDLDGDGTQTVIPLDIIHPMIYEDFFKIEWEPDWTLPFYGTSNTYSGASMTIEEIEE